MSKDKLKESTTMIASKDATERTKRTNAAMRSQLPFEDQQSFRNAARGFIATLDDVIITRPKDGKITYDLTDMKFLSEDAPDRRAHV
jgi:alkyl sulfatase BDS1-like metallo-beta-lactamase superfamily hydrolase